jgi:rRNA-processing protein FCF1
MSTLVAVLDADVLVPILSCDLLLSAFDQDLYRPVITVTILDEIERTLVDAFTHLDPVALRARVAQVAAALSLHTHDEGDVNAAALATVNRKDRHVAATALQHGADLVVSNDRRLRREINALGRPLRAVTADEFAQQLLADQPDGIDAVIDALVAKRTRRPITRIELVHQLAATFPGFASELHRRAH